VAVCPYYSSGCVKEGVERVNEQCAQQPRADKSPSTSTELQTAVTLLRQSLSPAQWESPAGEVFELKFWRRVVPSTAMFSAVFTPPVKTISSTLRSSRHALFGGAKRCHATSCHNLFAPPQRCSSYVASVLCTHGCISPPPQSSKAPTSFVHA